MPSDPRLDFVSPGVPPRHALSREQLDPRHVAKELDDPLAEYGGLLAVPPARSKNDLALGLGQQLERTAPARSRTDQQELSGRLGERRPDTLATDDVTIAGGLSRG